MTKADLAIIKRALLMVAIEENKAIDRLIAAAPTPPDSLCRRCDTRAKEIIREQKTAQMYSTIQTGTNMGMQTLEMALIDLVRRGLVTKEDAIKKAQHVDELKRMIGGGGPGAPVVKSARMSL